MDDFDAPIEAPDPEERERLRSLATSVAAVAGALLVVGGGIFLMLRDAGSLHPGPASQVASPAPTRMPADASGSGAPGARPSAPSAAAATVAPGIDRTIPTAAASGLPGQYASGEIVRCSVDGQTIYSNVPCAKGPARPVPVAVNRGFRPLADRQSIYNTQVEAAQAAWVPEPQFAPESSPPSAKALQCHSLDQAIADNEDAARHPLPGWRQDQLSEEHRSLEDRRHTLRC